MADIEELMAKHQKKKAFIKKTRRPWDSVTDSLSAAIVSQSDLKPDVNATQDHKDGLSETLLTGRITDATSELSPKNHEQTVSKLEANGTKFISNPLVTGEEPLSELVCVSPNIKPNLDVSEALARRELDVSKVKSKLNLDASKTLARRVLDVSKTLVKVDVRDSDVSQTLAQALARREPDVSSEKSQTLAIAFLIKVEKKFLIYVCNECKKLGSLETNWLSTDELKTVFNVDSSRLRNIIFRLREKGYFEVSAKTIQHTGLRKFKIPQHIYQEFLAQTLARRMPDVSETYAQTLAQTLANDSSSSSLKEGEPLKTTTTTKPELPDEWKEIDCAPLREQAEGFGEDHLRRLLKLGKTTPEQVQENIQRIAFAIKHKTQTFRKTPIAMLMGLCSEGKYFDPPKGYGAVKKDSEPENFNQGEPPSTPEEIAEAEKAKIMIRNMNNSLFGAMPK